MRKIPAALFLALNSSIAVHAAALVGVVQVAPVVPYVAEAGPSAQALNNECHWNTQVIQALIKDAKGRVKAADQELGAFQGRKLVLQASSSADGGAASEKTPKWLAVSGKLLDKDVLIGDFKLRQVITEGSLQDCKILKEMSDDLGYGMAQWLKDPQRGISVAAAMATSNTDSVEEDVRKDCAWDTSLPKYLEEKTDGQVNLVETDINTLKERKLLLTVVDSRIAAGEGYARGVDYRASSGAKWINLTGILTENGQDIGSFKASRRTVKGWTGCGVMKSLSEDIGEDIVKWLKNPSMNAKLGEAN